MRIRRRILALGALGVVLTLQIVNRLRGPRVVARAISPDGVEMYMVQQPLDLCGMLKDPWVATRFICRTTNGVWKSYYYSHEETYWFTPGRFSLDTNTATAVVYRKDDAVVSFQWRDGTYQITRPYADGTPRVPRTVEAQVGISTRWLPSPRERRQ